MQLDPRPYRVVSVRHAVSGEAAPPEISERFLGRSFAANQLEERGVRITGGRILYTGGGRDFVLELSPQFGSAG